MVRLKRLLAILAVAMLPQIATAQQITNYPSASTPLSGSEIIYLIQNGVSMQTTVGSLLPATTAGLFAAPPPIGSTTPNSGAFSTLSATGAATFGGTLSGAGVTALLSSYAPLASPTFTGTINGAAEALTGNETIGGTLGVTGAATFSVINTPSTSSPIYIKNAPNGTIIGSFGGTPATWGFNAPVHLSPPTTWAGISTSAGFYQNTSVTGTSSSSTFYNLLQMVDNVADSSSQGSAELLASLSVGGSSSSGSKNTFVSNFGMVAASGNTTGAGGSYSAGQFTSSVSVNDNGTAATQAGARGLLYGTNTVAHLGSGATFWNSLIGDEHDVNADPGSSVLIKLGMQIVQQVANGAQGSTDDAAISINNGNSQTSGVGWKNGLLFGRPSGQFPMDPLGTMIGAVTQSGTMLAANGIDWHLVTFSGNSWNDGHIQMTGAGDLLANSATALATAATAGFFHLPHTAAAPTGTPTNSTPGCEWNTASHTMNCYDGASWYHFTGTSGAS